MNRRGAAIGWLLSIAALSLVEGIGFNVENSRVLVVVVFCSLSGALWKEGKR